MNYFSLFDIKEQYDIDIDTLEQRYQLLQRMTHPDKFANASEQKKRMNMQKNTQVNDGYFILKDPVARGEHLLSVRGVELKSEQATIGDGEFLVKQMEMREELAKANTKATVEQLRRSVDEEIADYKDRIAIIFYQHQAEKSKHAANELLKLKLLCEFSNDCKQKIKNLVQEV